MPISRRKFMRFTIAAGPVAMALWCEKDLWAAGQCGMPATDADCDLPTPAPAQRFIPNEPVVRVRYSAREMAEPSMAAQLKSFRDGICHVRDLPKTDVISWTKQVAQHCIHCAGSNTQNIHYDQMFLPWHRAMLYFLERILRKQAKNDELRLIYWDWENRDSRTLPAIYAPADQPLYWANRMLTGPRWPLTDANVDVQGLLAVPDFSIFGGTAAQRNPVPAAYSGPHANVHNAFSPGDMGNLQFSPRDPVFYAHHGNIDRLWSSWVAAGHKNPDFGDAKVYFYDEDRVWRYVLLDDLRDESRLGYRYSTLMRPLVSPKLLRSLSVTKRANLLALAPQAMTQLRANGPEFLIIRNLHNPETLAADAVDFGIFAGKPAVGTASASFKGFLGTVSRVLSSGHDHRSPLSAALNVTGKLGAPAELGKGTLDLSVAPLDASGKTTAAAVPLAADDLQVVG